MDSYPLEYEAWGKRYLQVTIAMLFWVLSIGKLPFCLLEAGRKKWGLSSSSLSFMFRCPLLSACHLAGLHGYHVLAFCWRELSTKVRGWWADSRAFFHWRGSMLQLAKASGEIYSSAVCSPVQWHVWQQEVRDSARRHGDHWDRKSPISLTSFLPDTFISPPASTKRPGGTERPPFGVFSAPSLPTEHKIWDRIW